MAGIFTSLFSRLFSDFSKENPPFYHIYGNYMLSGTTPIQVDMTDLYAVYVGNPVLRAVIDKKAEMFKNMEICLKDKNGKDVEEHPVLTLLKNPNPLQSQEQFFQQLSIYIDIYTHAFIYKLQPAIKFDPLSPPNVLWNLPPGMMEIDRTGKLWQQSTVEGIIKGYKIHDGSNMTFTPAEIINITSQNGQAYLTGESKLLSLRMAISNIDSALKTRNVIINDRGALGILSSSSKDSDGAIPLDSKERERIEKAYREKYGIGDDKMKLIITNSDLKWQPMSYPTKDLMLFEEIEDDINLICGAFGVARDCFPSTKGATFENQREAYKQTYQNTIQPEADWIMRILSSQFGLTQQGMKLEAEYDWLPIMKDDELKEGQAEEAEQAAISTQIQYVINLNDAVKQGKIGYDQAINLLVMSEEYTMDEAKLLISQQPSGTQAQNTGTENSNQS